MANPHRILIVDDEEEILALLQKLLEDLGHQSEIARNGLEALTKIDSGIDLVLLDVKMPGMDGFEVARQIRKHPRAGDVPIIMVTALGSQTDRLEAVRAGANDFISKPIQLTELEVRAASQLKMKDAQDQIKNQRAQIKRAFDREKELLEKTLKGSVRILVDTLSLLNPMAFSQGARLRRYVREICTHLVLPDAWQYELAAMLSQVGCVTLPAEVLYKYHTGELLSAEEGKMFSRHPAVARDLLVNIPRLEVISKMVEKQDDNFSNLIYTADPKERPPEILGAQILNVVIHYDLLVERGTSHNKAVSDLRKSALGFDPLIVSALRNMHVNEQGEIVEVEPARVKLTDLTTEMILDEDLHTDDDLLLARKGQEVSKPFLDRLRIFIRRQDVPDEIRVLIPQKRFDG